jgi:hypothetical protein
MSKLRCAGAIGPKQWTARGLRLEQALYWRQIYIEILAMEVKVLLRIRHLMKGQSEEGRREVERTNVPVVVAQAERFRQRLGYWDVRVVELGGASKVGG